MKALLIPFVATVLSVPDGDTVKVHVEKCSPAFLCTIDVRVLGIDTPESHKPPAKCDAEVQKGQAAAAFGRALIRPGDRLNFTFRKWDKFGGRIDGTITLPDGRDYAETIIGEGLARPYDGKAKSSWCD